MKKDLTKNLGFLLIYFIFVTLVNKLFSFSFWPLYLGGVVGLFLPNLDHLLYVFVFKPFELTSQRLTMLFKDKRYKEAIMLLYDTKFERTDLIFHTINFQLIFLVLTFWVISSSGNNFGRGLVLGFFLNEVIYIYKNNSDRKYFWIALLALLVFGIMI